MPTLHFYNTLTRKLEVFAPINPELVTLYTCGPTVYDYAHIGNLRAYTFADTLKRTLLYLGYKVHHTMNTTDVGQMDSDADLGEDKIMIGVRRAAERGEQVTAMDIAKLYTEKFIHDRDSMNILPPDELTPATEHIDAMIELIKILKEKGFAYKTSRAVYFDVSKFPTYTQLSGQKLEEQLEGVREEVVVDPEKRHPADFRLWQLDQPNHSMLWDSPWGKGFPGWHIECSAMAMEYLGETIDIHTGGVDHIPVHHTNEIAQSEAATGKKFVNYWLHNEFIRVNNVKMSKSKNNFYSMKDIIDHNFSPMDLRYLYLEAHYRFPQNFTWEALQGARSARLNVTEQVAILLTVHHDQELENIENHELRNKFANYIADDLNIPGALSVMWEVVRSKELPGSTKLALLLDFDNVLGLELEKIPTIYTKFSLDEIAEIQKLLDDRENAKKSKDWSSADELRNHLTQKNVRIIDTSEGPVALLG
ncbi:cysteine--tRNA ligase [bacterium]|nr:cysteine--tRNA ligase [bacterium]